MRLTVFNGSPRGSKSNTKILIEKFLEGFGETSGNTSEIFYLNRIRKQDELVRAFSEADHIILATPLYTDAMPAMVKNFIEALQQNWGAVDNKSIGFIVQSGFGEAIHSKFVGKYLKKLATRQGYHYLGTIIRGGCEGIREIPSYMTKSLFTSFYKLGKTFGTNRTFDSVIMNKLAKADRFSLSTRIILNLLDRLGFTDARWNNKLKKNNAFEKRYDKPYLLENIKQ